MSLPKIEAIGALIGVAFFQNAISVFTPNWLAFSAYEGYKSPDDYGIVPYKSEFPFWFSLASWLMFASFGLFFFLAGGYSFIGWKVRQDGCSSDLRIWFQVVAGFMLVIAIIQIVAFTLIAIFASGFVDKLWVYKTSLPGYSAFLALSSAIHILIAIGLAGYVAFVDLSE